MTASRNGRQRNHIPPLLRELQNFDVPVGIGQRQCAASVADFSTERVPAHLAAGRNRQFGADMSKRRVRRDVIPGPLENADLHGRE